MRVVLFGATGMIGAGVLIECLAHESVESVLAVGRRPSGRSDPRLEDLVISDVAELSQVEDRLRGCDACFYCLGISAAGQSEEAYHRITFDVTVAIATKLLELNPRMVFCYVSAAGADSTERGRVMWARVKGETENRLLAMGFRAAFMFRPSYVQPMKGVRSQTGLYNALYAVLGPIYPVLRRLAPDQVTTTEKIDRAMIRVGAEGAPWSILGPREINELAGID